MLMISSMIVSRILSPKELGVFSVCIAMFSVINVIRIFGFPSYIIQSKTLTSDIRKTVFSISFFISVITAFLMMIFAGKISVYYNEAGVQYVLYIFALICVITPFSLVPFAVLKKEMNFKKLMYIEFCETIIIFSTTIILVYLGFSYYSLVYAILAAAVYNLLVSALFLRANFVFKLGFKDVLNVFNFTVPLTFTGIISVANNNAAPILMGTLIGLSNTAIYEKALSISIMVSIIVYPAINQVLVSKFAMQKNSGKNNQDEFILRVRDVCIVFIPILFTLSLLSPTIVYLMYGEQWEKAWLVCSLLCVSRIFSSPMLVVQTYFIANGSPKIILYLQLFQATIKYVGYYLTYEYGILYMAFFEVFVEAFSFVFSVLLINFKLGSKSLGFIYAFLLGCRTAFFVSIVPISFVLYFGYSHVLSLGFFSLFICLCSLMWFVSVMQYDNSYKKIIGNVIFRKFQL